MFSVEIAADIGAILLAILLVFLGLSLYQGWRMELALFFRMKSFMKQ